MTNRPEIIMTIRNRNVTVFTCDTDDCEWSRIAIGTPSSAEREALEHLKTHDESEDK